MDCAIVILNWNGRNFLERYIPTLLDCTPADNCFVVVADNGSEDGSVEWLKANHPDIRIIEFDRNWGLPADNVLWPKLRPILMYCLTPMWR